MAFKNSNRILFVLQALTPPTFTLYNMYPHEQSTFLIRNSAALKYDISTITFFERHAVYGE